MELKRIASMAFGCAVVASMALVGTAAHAGPIHRSVIRANRKMHHMGHSMRAGAHHMAHSMRAGAHHVKAGLHHTGQNLRRAGRQL